MLQERKTLVKQLLPAYDWDHSGDLSLTAFSSLIRAMAEVQVLTRAHSM